MAYKLRPTYMYARLHVGETGAGCNAFCLGLIDYLYYSGKATKDDFIWKGHLSAWFSSGFEVPHTCSFRVVNVLKQVVKCCNMPHITGSVATIPWDNCNTMSQNIYWEQRGQLQHFCFINHIVTLLFIEGNQTELISTERVICTLEF